MKCIEMASWDVLSYTAETPKREETMPVNAKEHILWTREHIAFLQYTNVSLFLLC
jgi:hypothetical protein